MRALEGTGSLWKKQHVLWTRPWPTGMSGGGCAWQWMTTGTLLQPPGLSSLSESFLLCPPGPGAQRGEVSILHHSQMLPPGLWWPPPPSSPGIDSQNENAAASYQDQTCEMILEGGAGRQRSRAQGQKTL